MYVRISLSNFITSFSFSTVESYNRHLLKQTSKQTWVKVTLVKINVCSVSQSCPTFCNPLDWSPPGSSVHRTFLSKNAGMGCHFFLQEIFLTQGSNPCLLCLLYYSQILYLLSHGRSTSKD